MNNQTQRPPTPGNGPRPTGTRPTGTPQPGQRPAGAPQPGRPAPKRPSTGERVWEGFKTALTAIVMIAAIAMMIFTIVSVTTFDRNDRALLGFKAFIVRSDSMKATDFAAGDLVLIREVDPTTLVEGDIISFRSIDPETYGETFTHKIRAKTVTEDGYPAFTTYGTTTGVDDAYPVGYEQILGQYQLALPKVGSFFTFLKTVPGYICCILLPFVFLIVLQGLKSIRLFRQYKKQQMAEIEAQRRKEMAAMAAERKRLAAERAQAMKMMEQLQAMQAKLDGQAGAGKKPTDE